jgi:hypothetical protein
LKTLHSDILLRVQPPIPVSSRFYGLQKMCRRRWRSFSESCVLLFFKIIPICRAFSSFFKISLHFVENLGLKINTTTEVFKGFFPQKKSGNFD